MSCNLHLKDIKIPAKGEISLGRPLKLWKGCFVTFVIGTNRPNAGKEEDNTKSQQNKTTCQSTLLHWVWNKFSKPSSNRQIWFLENGKFLTG